MIKRHSKAIFTVSTVYLQHQQASRPPPAPAPFTDASWSGGHIHGLRRRCFALNLTKATCAMPFPMPQGGGPAPPAAMRTRGTRIDPPLGRAWPWKFRHHGGEGEVTRLIWGSRRGEARSSRLRVELWVLVTVLAEARDHGPQGTSLWAVIREVGPARLYDDDELARPGRGARRPEPMLRNTPPNALARQPQVTIGGLAREELPRHDAHRVDVRLARVRLPAVVLRAHVTYGAHAHGRIRDVLAHVLRGRDLANAGPPGTVHLVQGIPAVRVKEDLFIMARRSRGRRRGACRLVAAASRGCALSAVSETRRYPAEPKVHQHSPAIPCKEHIVRLYVAVHYNKVSLRMQIVEAMRHVDEPLEGLARAVITRVNHMLECPPGQVLLQETVLDAISCVAREHNNAIRLRDVWVAQVLEHSRLGVEKVALVERHLMLTSM
mmetsp:Transcript_673/g.1840  ORF Transcript_673/g.1840 Transcript_673/m.1840 type:complete len:436 (+) Transcript_673:1526-2833(+)